MNGDYEAILAVVRNLVAVAFEGFMFVLPHAEAIVGVRIPIFQVARSFRFTREFTSFLQLICA